MKKIIILFVILLLPATFVFAEGEENERGAGKAPEMAVDEEIKGSKDITIGMVVQWYANEWFQEVIEGARVVAKREGVTFLVTSHENDSAREIAIMDDFIQRDVDAIAWITSTEAATRGVLWQAAKAGIPTITYVLEMRGAPQVAVIKFDNYGGSFANGIWAANYFKENRTGKPKLAIMSFPLYQSTIDRANGFIDGFKSVYPDAEIVAEQNAEGSMEKGMSIMENIIQANPDVNVVFGINDPCALGAASAVEAAGLNDVIVSGFDGAQDAKTAIKKGGVFKSSVLVFPDEMGTKIAEALINLAKDDWEKVTFFHNISYVILNPENVHQY
jgi:ribose transport system substrate-binding protein